MTIKGILFDLGYTLLTPKTNDWYLTECFYSFIPIETLHKTDPKQAHQSFQNAYTALHNDHKLTSRKQELEQWTTFYYDFVNGIDGLSITKEDAYTIAYDHTYNKDQFVLCDDTLETLKNLKQQGYTLGILSNTYPSAAHFIEELHILDYIDHATYSYELGKLKPDPDLYATAIEKMQLEPNEILFVDDLLANLIMAENFGLQPVLSLLNPNAKENKRYPSIKSPSDIFKILQTYNTLS